MNTKALAVAILNASLLIDCIMHSANTLVFMSFTIFVWLII